MPNVTSVTKLDSVYTMSRYSQCQYTGSCAQKHKGRKIERRTHMATETQDRAKALAWLARQLRWERALSDLRTGTEPAAERKAA